VNDQPSARNANTPEPGAEPLPGGGPVLRANAPHPSPWHPGALFYVSTRYSRKPRAATVDRLAGILRNGLLAPASCSDGSVCSDLNLVVTGTPVPYGSLVFLHRFGPESFLYTFADPGRFTVFVDPAIPVLRQEAMGTAWVVLCQDEVYVRDRVAPEHLIGVAVHHTDADSVVGGLIADFRRLGISMYDYDGNVLWEPA
jgi:hypothetical protein